MESTWNTAEDVLEDLALIGGNDMIDESYLVRSGKPPPLRRNEEEDNEIRERFGTGIVSYDDQYNNDFSGITQMLRMVDKLGTSDENLDTTNTNELKKPIIVISKLNPNVKEFIPTCQQKTTKEKLKNKILSNGGTLNDRKEKNVAIAALMKMNCSPQNIPATSFTPNNKQLIRDSKSPTIFSNSSSVSPSNALHKSSPPNNDTSLEPDSSKPLLLLTPEYYKSTVRKLDANCTVTVDDSINKVILELEEKESKEKVDDWFEHNEKVKRGEDVRPKSIEKHLEVKPEPKRQFVPIVDTIIYKRKSTPVSSNTKSSQEIDKPKPQSTPSYVPSTYAGELTKKYENQNKQKESLNRDIWSKLEEDLKAKDLEIKRKHEEKLKKEQDSSEASTPSINDVK